MCLTEDSDLKKQNEKQAVRSCFFLVPCRSMEEEQESGAQGVWSLMYSSVRERSEAITPSPASNGRAPTRVVNNNVLLQNHLSTPYRWNTPIDTANVAFTQEDPWGAVWGPTAQEWTQCGPHSTCCYPVTGKGGSTGANDSVWSPRNILWRTGVGQMANGWKVCWSQGRDHMERRKCKKNRKSVSIGIIGSVWGTVKSRDVKAGAGGP